MLQLCVCTYLYLLQLYDPGTARSPHTVSLCFSHQTWPSIHASVSVALEVLPFVVSVRVLGMISWNALQDGQASSCKRRFVFGRPAVVNPYQP